MAQTRADGIQVWKQSIMGEWTNNQPRHRAFTIVELLVVMFIIGLMMSIAMPAFSHAQESSRQALCQSNLRQLSSAWAMFPIDNMNLLVNGKPNNTDGWVHTGPGYQPIEDGTLFTYVNTVDAYRCPSDDSENERSMSITGTMRGENWDLHLTQPSNSWAMYGTDRLDAINSHDSQLVMLEELDSRGWNIGSWVMYVGQAQQWTWIDYLPTFHGEGTNFAFADGHVNFYGAKDRDTIFASHNEIFFLHDPGSKDWTYLREIYRQLDSHPNVQ